MTKYYNSGVDLTFIDWPPNHSHTSPTGGRRRTRANRSVYCISLGWEDQIQPALVDLNYYRQTRYLLSFCTEKVTGRTGAPRQCSRNNTKANLICQLSEQVKKQAPGRAHFTVDLSLVGQLPGCWRSLQYLTPRLAGWNSWWRTYMQQQQY